MVIRAANGLDRSGMIGLKAKLWAALAGLGGILMTVIYAMGRKDANSKNKIRKAKDDLETTERMRDAEPVDNNADAARKRLSKRK